MARTNSKLDQALADLVEAFVELEQEMDEKFGDDEEGFQTAIVEALETSIETAIEEQDSTTSSFASLVSCMSEALEHIDPSAFQAEDEEEEDEESEYDVDDSDLDYDEDDDLEGDDDEEDEDDDDDDDD